MYLFLLTLQYLFNTSFLDIYVPQQIVREINYARMEQYKRYTSISSASLVLNSCERSVYTEEQGRMLHECMDCSIFNVD
jgi:hypothetical protein